jgi:DME family drug/metabolite transporter
MSPRAVGIAAVVAAAVLWGSTGTMQALLPPDREPLAVGALRLLFGAAALALLALARPESRRAFARLPWRALGFAGAAIAAYNLLFFRAVLDAGVGVGTAVAIGSAPIWVTLFEIAAGKGLPRGLRLAGQAVSIAGAGLLVLAGGAEVGAATGVLLAALAGASYAAYSLATAQAGSGLPPATVAAATFGVAAALTAPVLLVAPPVWLTGGQAWAAVLFLGVGATGLSYALYTWGLGRVAASTAVTLALVEPMTAWLLATLIVGEPITASKIAGAAMILAGLAMVGLSAAPGRARASA